VHEPVGEVAIGREDDKALAVEVEPPRAEESQFVERAGEEIEDSAPVRGVAVAADVSTGLVDSDRDLLLRSAANSAAIHRDPIDRGVDLAARFRPFAIYKNLTRSDRRFRRAAGAEAEVGKILLDAKGFLRGFGGYSALKSKDKISRGPARATGALPAAES
jgi:hypothetical protein